MKTLWKRVDLFAIGGSIYGLIEVAWRGYTHWTMVCLGGVLFLFFGMMNRFLPEKVTLLQRGVVGGVCVTAAEFAVGYVVNLKMGLAVWDYSEMPFQLMGQVCLPFSLFWAVLSMAAMVLYGKICEFAWGDPAFHCALLRSAGGTHEQEQEIWKTTV